MRQPKTRKTFRKRPVTFSEAIGFASYRVISPRQVQRTYSRPVVTLRAFCPALWRTIPRESLFSRQPQMCKTLRNHVVPFSEAIVSPPYRLRSPTQVQRTYSRPVVTLRAISPALWGPIPRESLFSRHPQNCKTLRNHVASFSEAIVSPPYRIIFPISM